MAIIGIIAEYNPFHSGHKYQIEESRRRLGEASPVLCVMSGNWVQRGEPALFDKWLRAQRAVLGGANLVLELPTPWALSSAEGFARGAVSHLAATGLVTHLSFGSEAGALGALRETAPFLDSDEYPPRLRQELQSGCSFPVARQRAASGALSTVADCLGTANNNLAIEYLRALRHLSSPIEPFTVQRLGAAHDSTEAAGDFASASYLRRALLGGQTPLPFLTDADCLALASAPMATMQTGERAILAALRRMTPSDFAALPGCSEGLEQRLYAAAQQADSLTALMEQLKTKRYPLARLRRLVCAAYLALPKQPPSPAYQRPLAFDETGQALLRQMKQSATLPLLLRTSQLEKLPPKAKALFALEARATALYDLCRTQTHPHGAGEEARRSPQRVSKR